jgi:hypothetical protein
MALKIKRLKEPTASGSRTIRATVTFQQLKDILDNDTITFTIPAPAK